MLFAALVALNTIFMGVDVELELADQAHHGESVALSVIRRIFTVAFTATWLSGGRPCLILIGAWHHFSRFFAAVLHAEASHLRASGYRIRIMGFYKALL